MARTSGEIQFTGQISTIRFRNNDNHYTVAVVEGTGGEFDGNQVTITGHLPGVDQGDEVEIKGLRVVHPKYGPQIEVKSFSRILPSSQHGIEAYLKSGHVPGVGEKTAARIVRQFGTDALTVIQKQPEKLAVIKGLSKKKIHTIHRAVIDQRAAERTMLFLLEHGIPPGVSGRIYRHYGTDTISVIQDNPYRLCDDVFGIGFLTADRIARATGLPFHSNRRIAAAVRHVLSQAAHSQGHTFLPIDALSASVVKLLTVRDHDDVQEPIDTDAVAEVIAELGENGRLVIEANNVFLNSLWTAEQTVAEKLQALARPVDVSWSTSDLIASIDQVQRELDIEYADKQRQAIETAIKHGISVITGGPGTGKTTVIQGLLATIDKVDRAEKKLLACPTGRAAKRLSEATGLGATTIHRLLGFKPEDGRVWSFTHDEDNPLTGDLLIVDETSMIDVQLASDLLKAIRDGMRVVFVGDADQLPSVGPGNVLRDIIESGTVPTTVLEVVFRQGEGSDIVSIAHGVRRGQVPGREFWYRGDGVPGGEFAFVRKDDPVQAAAVTVDVAIELASCGKSVQVLAPMYRGSCGVDALNEALQDGLNPAQEGGAEYRYGSKLFRLGDRVMQVRNNYEKEAFNGDVGYIVDLVSDDGKAELVVDFEGSKVDYKADELDQLVLAYAVTVHKSQGSEFDVVLMAIARQHYPMLRRNLLYTAVSRAKNTMLIVGDSRSLYMAVNNDEVVKRFSKLQSRLNEEGGGS